MADRTIGAEVALTNLTKRFGAVSAVDNVTLTVDGGEFLALLGPSGSGKTTILSLIAGFESPSEGDILIGGRSVTRLPPHRRDIGMVFQHFALFPHLTVAENLAYPLRRRCCDNATIAHQVRKTLDLVHLQGLGSRFPNQLSGGQQQRVALARAIIFQPSLLLMDEPLGALDKKLRQQMQLELKLLHRALRTTIVLVTHDQEEALSMADRVAVIANGQLQQLGTPPELYGKPATAFVADFIGTTNFCDADVAIRNDEFCEVTLPGGQAFGPLQIPNTNTADNFVPLAGSRIRLGIRPEQVRLDGPVGARVLESSFAGSFQTVLVQVEGLRLIVHKPFVIGGKPVTAGETINLSLPANNCRLYPSEA